MMTKHALRLCKRERRRSRKNITIENPTFKCEVCSQPIERPTLCQQCYDIQRQ